MSLRDLLTMAEVQALRYRQSNAKPQTRLQQLVTDRALTIVDERQFKHTVWSRDGYRCRMCKRAVLRIASRVPERGEIHHLHGRRGWLKFEACCAILTCAVCHEKLTGRVNEKWVVKPLATVWWFSHGRDGVKYLDARKPLRFERVA